MSAPVFAAERLAFRYADAARSALTDVDLAVPEGRFQAIIGPNGSGKSTLARLLLGTFPPSAGRALFRGVDARALPRRELAREVGVVPQSETHAFPMSVGETVAMGRYPHLGPWRAPGAADRRAVLEAMERCDVVDLVHRPTGSLSGGERQRVLIARALAQQPRALVLDEPTASLDVRHEMAIFELLRALCMEGVTVLLVTHNLNLAARYADRLLMLDGGRAVAAGAARQVLDPGIVQAVYRWPIAVRPLGLAGPDADAPQVVPLRPERP
ncbi:MAG TPA: ABC transporter ATP-binding protein [Longimicrobiales bacterium]|nr:ABC transporter ATP-binding protein [Longimicrobiales bacterium]